MRNVFGSNYRESVRKAEGDAQAGRGTEPRPKMTAARQKRGNGRAVVIPFYRKDQNGPIFMYDMAKTMTAAAMDRNRMIFQTNRSHAL